MKTFLQLASAFALLLAGAHGMAQSTPGEDADELKIAALEALMSAPPQRVLPIVQKVLNGNSSDEVKERAMFVLSQIDLPEAQALLLDIARQGSGETRTEAIRMIGIGGDRETLAVLAELYKTGDKEVREAVLEAYLIADNDEGVYQLALLADTDEAYEDAVEALGAMGARDRLRELRNSKGVSKSLIEAYTMSDDHEALIELSRDASDPELQAKAIEALGIVDGPDTGRVLMEIYRSSATAEVRETALEGLLIADDDEALLELYRSSDSAGEKKRILEYLVMMDSDAVWDVVDAALGENR